MRIPLLWLGQHVDLDGISADTLSERLTIGGIEIEGDDALGVLHPATVVGRVVAWEADPKRAGLAWLTVDAGKAEPVLVATRSPNLQADCTGLAIAVALPGAQLFQARPDGNLTTLTVAAREMFGRPSGGVGCSALELGVGDDHTGVAVLNTDAPSGTPLSTVFSTRTQGTERVLTAAILPNIARCQSVLGVAREVGALAERPVSLDIALEPLELGSSPLDPTTEDADLCGFFSTALVEGVVVGPSPRWMQRRLLACGQQPRNNVVDVSNYVMMELGQPTHAYDADTLASLQLGVRRARDGDVFKPLVADDDDAPAPLPAGVPVITSDDGVVALAGVMGGHETRVTDGTTRLLLESAHFDYIAVRRSQAATLTYSEASARFSRDVDPSQIPVALARIVHLLRETCPDIQVVQTGCLSLGSLEPRPLSLSVSTLNHALGTELSAETVAAQLDRVALTSTLGPDGDTLTVQVPSSRPDITLPCDLMEEVARLHGYDRMPATMPIEAVPVHLPHPHIALRARIEDALVATGLQQTISYTLSSPTLEAKLRAGHKDAPEPPYVRLANPLSEDRAVFRRTVLAHLLVEAADNLRHSDGFHAFELGVVAWPEQEAADGLAREHKRLGIVMVGPELPPSLHAARPRAVDAHDLVGVLDHLTTHLHLPGVRREAATAVGFHPGVCAALFTGDTCLGHFGAVHPAVAGAFGLPDQGVFIAELDADAVMDAVPERFMAPSPPRFPSVRLDISVVVEDTVSAGVLEQTLRRAGGEVLRQVAVFDVYQGEPLAAHQKAVGFRFEVGADNRTLAMPEAEAVRDRIVAALSDTHGAALRS